MPDPNIPEGAVVITTADIYRQLLDLTREVGELKGAVQAAAKISKNVEDHESRLRSLEKARWPLPALAILISLAAAIATIVTALQG